MSRPGDPEVSLGDYLGDLTSELPPDQFIKTYAAGGPKHYGYQTSDGSEVMKVRGFTLSWCNSQKITFDTLKEMVFNYPNTQNPIPIINAHKICRDTPTYRLYNRVEIKRYNITYTKRFVLDNLDTLPFGWVFDE